MLDHGTKCGDNMSGRTSEKTSECTDMTCGPRGHETDARACMCRRAENAVRYLKLGVCVCVLLTLLSFTACCMSVRSALFTYEQLQVYREWERQAQNTGVRCDEIRNLQVKTDQIPSAESPVPSQQGLQKFTQILRRVERGAGNGTSSNPRHSNKRNRKGKGKGKNRGKTRGRNKNFCSKVSRCISPMDPGKPAPPRHQSKDPLKASHFTVDGTTVAGQTIGAFRPARWVHANVVPAATPSNNEVSVTEDGVYLVYSTVLFNDTKYREGLVVKRNNHELFKCFDGVDHIDRNKTREQNFKFKTCSVSGVTYLSKGDNLKMVNLYPDTNLDTSEGSTFFGLVQLIPATRSVP